MATRFNYVQTSQDDKISPVILGGRGKGYKWKGSKDSNDSGPKLAVQFVVQSIFFIFSRGQEESRHLFHASSHRISTRHYICEAGSVCFQHSSKACHAFIQTTELADLSRSLSLMTWFFGC